MARFWPSSFFCVFMNRDGVEVHKLAKKKVRGQCLVILAEIAWSIKHGQYLTFREIRLVGPTRSGSQS